MTFPTNPIAVVWLLNSRGFSVHQYTYQNVRAALATNVEFAQLKSDKRHSIIRSVLHTLEKQGKRVNRGRLGSLGFPRPPAASVVRRRLNHLRGHDSAIRGLRDILSEKRDVLIYDCEYFSFANYEALPHAIAVFNLAGHCLISARINYSVSWNAALRSIAKQNDYPQSWVAAHEAYISRLRVKAEQPEYTIGELQAQLSPFLQEGVLALAWGNGLDLRVLNRIIEGDDNLFRPRRTRTAIPLASIELLPLCRDLYPECGQGRSGDGPYKIKNVYSMLLQKAVDQSLIHVPEYDALLLRDVVKAILTQMTP